MTLVTCMFSPPVLLAELTFSSNSLYTLFLFAEQNSAQLISLRRQRPLR
jgi:hypothetical protein